MIKINPIIKISLFAVDEKRDILHGSNIPNREWLKHSVTTILKDNFINLCQQLCKVLINYRIIYIIKLITSKNPKILFNFIYNKYKNSRLGNGKLPFLCLGDYKILLHFILSSTQMAEKHYNLVENTYDMLLILFNKKDFFLFPLYNCFVYVTIY